MEEQKPVRINKYLSQIGYCSRRKADELLNQGRIKIDGKVPELGTKIIPGQEILVDNLPIKQQKNEHVYILLNKPKGIVCTTDTRVEKDNIIDFVNYHKRIFPIGRLDKMSEGLILLTNDGDIVNQILRAKHKNEKEYIVKVDRNITQDFLDKMANGVAILDTVTLPCKVEKVDNQRFKIVLTQGLNRQIRRMCEALDYKVLALKRIRLMHLFLDVPQGEYRELNNNEVSRLKSALAKKN
jgi:23S rRNA pseudouridine2604 synthase